jgi:hypothetical protein
MKKRTVKKLELHRESLRQLDPQEIREAAAAAATVAETCTACSNRCTLGSCGHICP